MRTSGHEIMTNSEFMLRVACTLRRNKGLLENHPDISVFSDHSKLLGPTALVAFCLALSSIFLKYYDSKYLDFFPYYLGICLMICSVYLLLHFLSIFLLRNRPSIYIVSRGLKCPAFAENFIPWDAITKIDEWQFSLLPSANVPVRLIRVNYKQERETSFGIRPVRRFFRYSWHEQGAFSIATGSLTMSHENLLAELQFRISENSKHSDQA
jgi:hypothetical protein